MSLIEKSSSLISGAVSAVVLLASVAVWQFYQFVTYRNSAGVLETQGGTGHLVTAAVVGLIACAVAFWVFSVYARHDESDEIHITSL